MKKEKLQELVSRMKEYLDEVGYFEIEMNRTQLALEDVNYPCGCHAGFISAVFGESDGIDWEESSRKLCNFLGFNLKFDLEDWAQDNPEIWGNEDGIFMFSDGTAFGSESRIFSAEIILNHWEGVLERLGNEKFKEVSVFNSLSFVEI